MFQCQNSRSRSTVDEHLQLAVGQFDGQEVGHVLDKVVRRRPDVEQHAFLHLSVEHERQVRVGAGREARVPRPALAVVRSCESLTVGAEEVRIVCRALALVAVRKNLTGAIVQTRVWVARSNLRLWRHTAAEGVDPGVDTNEGSDIGENCDRLFVNLELIVTASFAVGPLLETLVDVDHDNLDTERSFLLRLTK